MRTIISHLYVSAASPDFDERALAQLVATARANNTWLGVTGMLLYAERTFLQVLEGEASIVDRMMARIASDRRHRHTRVLARSTALARRFGGWSLAFCHPDAGAIAAALSVIEDGSASGSNGIRRRAVLPGNSAESVGSRLLVLDEERAMTLLHRFAPASGSIRIAHEQSRTQAESRARATAGWPEAANQTDEIDTAIAA